MNRHTKTASCFPSLLDQEIRKLSKSKRMAKVYYTARKLKAKGYQVDTANRSFDLPFTSINEVPVGDRYYVRQLIRLGFNHQLKMF